MFNTLRRLGDRNLGFILGLVVVLNLACGSLVMNFYPDLYPRFALLEFNFFFDPIQPVHFWFYLLIVVLFIFGLNLTVCAIEAFIKLLKSNQQRRHQISALLCHLAIILALIAHLHEGLSGTNHQVMISSQGREIPLIGRATTEAVTNFMYPDGSLKDTEASVTFQTSDGIAVNKTISYNVPAIFNAGIDQVILFQGENRPNGITLVSEPDKNSLQLTLRNSVVRDGGILTLSDIVMTRQNIPFAIIHWQPRNGQEQLFYLALDKRFAGHKQFSTGKSIYRFEKALEEPVIIAMLRHNPSIPYMLISTLLLAVGCLLLIRIRTGKNDE